MKYQVLFAGEKAPRAYVAKNSIGKATFPNKDVYEGGYQDAKRNGDGKYVWSKEEGAPFVGAVYVGAYKDGMRNGQGTMTYPDKSKYIGEWVQNIRHGRGTYIYPNGDRYCGNWANNQKLVHAYTLCALTLRCHQCM